MSHNENEEGLDGSKRHKLTRREALSTAGKAAIGAGALVVAGGAGYILTRGPDSEPVPGTVTVTKRETETKTATETQVQTKTRTRTQTNTQTLTQTVKPADQVWITYVDNSSTGNPDPALRTDVPGIRMYQNLYDNLVRYDLESPANVVPQIATGWEISNDGKTIKFPIRKNVKFHDGSDLDAEAVKFSMDRIMTMNRGAAFMWNGVISAGTGSEVVGDNTFQLNLTKPYGPLMATLPFFYIVSPTFVKKHMAEGPYGAMGDYASNHMLKGHDAGSGPYILKKFQSDVGYDFTRNNDYWAGWTADKLYGFHFMKVAEEATHKQMFAAGLAHITGSFKSTEFVKWVDATDGMEVEYQHKPINPHFIFMNTTNPPFDDKNFRKAMAHIFPYSDFLENIRGSIGDKRMTGPLTRAFWGHNEDLTRYEEDIAKAKSLIAASKYADTSAVREIKFNYINTIEWEKLAGLGMQANAKQLGLNMKVQSLPWSQYSDGVSDKTTAPDLVAVTHAGYFLDPDALLYNAWHSFPKESITWARNPTHFGGNNAQSGRVDKLLDDARLITDKTKRAAMYKEVQSIINDECPAIFAMEQVGYIPHNSQLQNIVYNVEYFNVYGIYHMTWTGPAPR
jgi:peptide/nickel transport system substrate-binding protein